MTRLRLSVSICPSSHDCNPLQHTGGAPPVANHRRALSGLPNPPAW